MSQHTPGPWTVEGPFGPVASQGDRLIVGGDKRRSTVAEIPRGDPAQNDERHADARLIAAAPEMLEFIQAFQSTINRQDDLWDTEGYPTEDLEILLGLMRTLLARIEGRDTP